MHSGPDHWLRFQIDSIILCPKNRSGENIPYMVSGHLGVSTPSKDNVETPDCNVNGARCGLALGASSYVPGGGGDAKFRGSESQKELGDLPEEKCESIWQERPHK